MFKHSLVTHLKTYVQDWVVVFILTIVREDLEATLLSDSLRLLGYGFRLLGLFSIVGYMVFDCWNLPLTSEIVLKLGIN